MIADLTIFATPKPFERHIGIAQRNAIQSWLLLRPRPRIILLGDDHGTGDVAREFCVEHIPDVERNEFGTPLLRSIFAKAHGVTPSGLMMYVNADIILTSDIARALDILPPMDRFLLVGQRTDMYVRYAIDFSAPNWEVVLRQRAAIKGKAAGPKAMDYFVFPSNMFKHVPNFAVGRGWWDHWLVAEARRAGATIVDATRSVLAVHQNHDYNASEEALRNLALYGMASDAISLDVASQELCDGQMRPRSVGQRTDESLMQRLAASWRAARQYRVSRR